MKKIIALLCFVFAVPALAATDQGTEAMHKVLNSLLPGETPDSIRASEIAGLYEVAYGPRLFYLTGDGRFLVSGDLIDLRSQANLTEQRRGKARVDAVNGLGEKSMVVYAPKGKAKHTVTVFTDIDCPYCRKLHQEVSALNDLGIKVRYLAFPRSGVDTPSYGKAVSVWCAKDRNKAMDQAKAMTKLEPANCEHPVRQHMAMAETLGVSGTPAIVLEDGRIIPGYVPAQRLLNIIETGQ